MCSLSKNQTLTMSSLSLELLVYLPTYPFYHPFFHYIATVVRPLRGQLLLFTRICPSLLYLRVSGGGHFCVRCILPFRALLPNTVSSLRSVFKSSLGVCKHTGSNSKKTVNGDTELIRQDDRRISFNATPPGTGRSADLCVYC